MAAGCIAPESEHLARQSQRSETKQSLAVRSLSLFTSQENTMEKVWNIAARLLMAQIFILSGWSKIAGYSGTQQYFASLGLPGALVPLVILVELGGGLALLFGFKARWAAAILALFTIGSAFIAHTNFADQMQMINFMKNLAIAGGLLMFVRYGAESPSIDSMRDTTGARLNRQ
jgi:putative oxidoreductase